MAESLSTVALTDSPSPTSTAFPRSIPLPKSPSAPTLFALQTTSLTNGSSSPSIQESLAHRAPYKQAFGARRPSFKDSLDRRTSFKESAERRASVHETVKRRASNHASAAAVSSISSSNHLLSTLLQPAQLSPILATPVSPTGASIGPTILPLPHSRPNLATLPLPLLGISTRMHLDHAQTLAFAISLADVFGASAPALTAFLLPAASALTPCAEVLRRWVPRVLLGAQACHWDEEGEYSGVESAKTLNQIGCRVVGLGRWDGVGGVVEKTIAAVLRNAMVPMVSVGETVDGDVGMVKKQVEEVLEGVEQDVNLVIIYEPCLAEERLGMMDQSSLLAVLREIKQTVAQRHSIGTVRVLYGGPVGPGTWEALREGADGLLMGKFALEIGNMRRVVEEVEGITSAIKALGAFRRSSVFEEMDRTEKRRSVLADMRAIARGRASVQAF